VNWPRTCLRRARITRGRTKSAQACSDTQLVPITKVYPVPVLEVAADPALNAGGYRHLLRYIRLRADMDPTDVEGP
jgi:hypothetical protein